MESIESLLDRFHTLTAQEREALEARVEAKFQAKIDAMTTTEKQALAATLRTALEK